MKSIKKLGFPNYLYLTEDGRIYNQRTRRYRKPYADNCFKLKLENGKYKTISLKNLYWNIYNKVFCIDNIQDLQNEQWKPVEGTNEYFVSNKGRIKSYKGYKAIILQSWKSKETNGYLVVKMNINGVTKNYYIHRLVAAAFVDKPEGYKEEQLDVHHKSISSQNNRFNNNSDNLIWLTKQQHKAIHGQYNKKLEQKKRI